MTLANRSSGVLALAYSPDGRLLAASEGYPNGTVAVWDLVAPKVPIAEWKTDMHVVGLAFHPDGKRVATSGVDGAVKVWNVSTGKLLMALDGCDGPHLWTEYSPDGRCWSPWPGHFHG